MRAADALTRISPLGISHPVRRDLFEDAASAPSRTPERSTTSSLPQLDVDRFFFSVRPTTSRTASAARSTAARTRATSRESTRSTCCSASVAGTTRTTRSCSSRRCSSCSRPTRRACATACGGGASRPAPRRAETSREREWFQRSAAAFLRVCEAHGRVAAQHHDQLVARFIEAPSKALDESHLAQVTASGPPLPVLLSALEVLRDLRLAAPRDDIASRYADVARLRAAVEVPAS